MTLKEKREHVLNAFEGKPYIYDGIPLFQRENAKFFRPMIDVLIVWVK